MRKPVLLLVLLIVAVLAVYTSTKAQRQSGRIRIRIQKVTEVGIQGNAIYGDPDVVGFSCASALADTEPTCYVLLRDRVF